MELISPTFRLEFREFCIRLALGQIDDVFQMSGVQPGPILDGRTRNCVLHTLYINITLRAKLGKFGRDAQKLLQVVGLVISQSYIS